MVWFGVGELSRVLLIIYATGFIVMINAETGVGAVEQEKVAEAWVSGCISFEPKDSTAQEATVSAASLLLEPEPVSRGGVPVSLDVSLVADTCC